MERSLHQCSSTFFVEDVLMNSCTLFTQPCTLFTDTFPTELRPCP